MLVVAARSVMRAYNQDRLVTSGVSSLVRHPIYSGWIVFIVPGLVLLSRSWPALLTPLVAYAVFKLLTHREDEYLQQRFGAAYLAYRARVNELVPIPHFGQPKNPSEAKQHKTEYRLAETSLGQFGQRWSKEHGDSYAVGKCSKDTPTSALGTGRRNPKTAPASGRSRGGLHYRFD